LYIEPFVNAGLFYHAQFLDNQHNYLCFEEFVGKFNLSSDNETYLHYVTLYLAISESWGNFDSLSNQPQTSIDLLRIAKENAVSNWSVTKKMYLHLTNSTFPEKQQLRWADEFSLNSNTINWTKIYTTNYYCTLLRSFQIKLNLRAILTNIQFLWYD